MSFDPSFQTTSNFISSGDVVRFDDNQYFTNYAEINALQNKNIQITYIALDTGNRYRWDGATLILLVAGGGAVNSVSGGHNINITGTANNPIVNVNTSISTSISTNTSNISLNSTNISTNLSKITLNSTNISGNVSGIQTNSTNISTNASSISLHVADINNPHSTTKAQVGLSNVENTKVNMTAIVAPTSGNDNTQGYTIGSRWIDTITDKEYVALDVSTGIAVWKETTSINTINAITDLSDVNDSTRALGTTLVFDGTEYKAGQTYSTLDITNTVLFNADFNANTNDNSTYASTGTIVGTVNSIAGKLGNAYQFTGSNSYIKYGNQSRLNFTNNSTFSVNFWIRSTNVGSSDYLIMSQAEGPSGSGWYITMQPANERIEMKFADVNTARELFIRWQGLTDLVNNVWNFVSITKEDGITSDKLKLYYNGVLRDDIKSVLINTLLIGDNIQVVSAEYNIASRNNGEGNELVGDLDNVQIFNTVLIPSMITSFYNNNVGLQNDYNVLNILPHTHLQSDIIGLVSTLTTNSTNISTNTSTNIVQSADISTNTSTNVVQTTNISTNLSRITLNSTNISSNTSSIVLNTSGITSNSTNISTNLSRITLNSTNISTTVANSVQTASNIGVAGVGLFKQKTGTDLEFKKINAGSSNITITDDSGNNELDVNLGVNSASGSLKLSGANSVIENDNFNGNLERVDINRGGQFFAMSNSGDLAPTWTHQSNKIDIVPAGSNTQSLFAYIPMGGLSFRINFKEIRGDLQLGASQSDAVYGHYVCWQAFSASAIANVRFGLAYAHYLKGAYGYGVSATSNNGGLYNASAEAQIITCNFTTSAGTSGAEIHQADTRNADFMQGTAYGANFTAGDLIILSTWGSPQGQIRIISYSVSGSTATFRNEYRLALRSGSFVGCDVNQVYLPYINITDTSQFALVGQRYLNTNITTWVHTGGAWDNAKSLNFYY